MTANAVSILLPASYIPLATGATQLTQTPSGVPTNIPIKLLRKRLSEGCLGSIFQKGEKTCGDNKPECHTAPIGLIPIQSGYHYPCRKISVTRCVKMSLISQRIFKCFDARKSCLSCPTQGSERLTRSYRQHR